MNLFCMILCAVTHYAYGMDSISRTQTKYIVVSHDPRIRTREVTIKNFNDIVERLESLSKTEEGSTPDAQQYISLRLSVMQAISKHIERCFIKHLVEVGRKSGKDDELEELDIEKKYQRNINISQARQSQAIDDLVVKLLPCDLLTGKNMFHILLPTRRSMIGGLFEVYKNYVRDDAHLVGLNKYIAWVETLIILTLLEISNFQKVQEIGKHLLMVHSKILEPIGVGAKIVKIQSVIQNYTKQDFTNVLKKLLEELSLKFEEQFDKKVADPQEAMGVFKAIYDILIQVIEINALFAQLDINLPESVDRSIIYDFEALEVTIINALKKAQISDQDIDEIKDFMSRDPESVLSDFKKELSAIKKNRDKYQAQLALDELLTHLEWYMKLLQVTNVDTKIFNKLKETIERYKSSLHSSSDDLLNLQFRLQTLQSIAG